MNKITRALSAIKGQQHYYGYSAERIDKEGVVLTSRNTETVVEALEKQIPKKPTGVKNTTFNGSIRGEHFKSGDCPSCNNYVDTDDNSKFCAKCGQKLDW